MIGDGRMGLTTTLERRQHVHIADRQAFVRLPSPGLDGRHTTTTNSMIDMMNPAKPSRNCVVRSRESLEPETPRDPFQLPLRPAFPVLGVLVLLLLGAGLSTVPSARAQSYQLAPLWSLAPGEVPFLDTGHLTRGLAYNPDDRPCPGAEPHGNCRGAHLGRRHRRRTRDAAVRRHGRHRREFRGRT